MKFRKIIALPLIIIYALVVVNDGSKDAIGSLLYLFIPLSLIFFSESIGSYTGIINSFHHPITDESPGWAVEFMGWVILLLPIIVVFFS